MKTLRILLADDHEMVRLGLRALLNASPDIEVVGEARDGMEACRRARELDPDVVVMDVSMPVLAGAEATERLREECPHVRVLALTMHEDLGHLRRLLQAGVSGYVLKRAAPDELIRAIRTVVSGGTYVDPELAGRLLSAGSRSRVSRPATSGDPLSDREEEVLRMIAWGKSNKEIALELEISTKTVETYKARITEKLGLRSRTEMVRYAVDQGWLSQT
jgi:DNA-binding NarL/FixJ family response regulator